MLGPQCMKVMAAGKHLCWFSSVPGTLKATRVASFPYPEMPIEERVSEDREWAHSRLTV